MFVKRKFWDLVELQIYMVKTKTTETKDCAQKVSELSACLTHAFCQNTRWFIGRVWWFSSSHQNGFAMIVFCIQGTHSELWETVRGWEEIDGVYVHTYIKSWCIYSRKYNPTSHTFLKLLSSECVLCHTSGETSNSKLGPKLIRSLADSVWKTCGHGDISAEEPQPWAAAAVVVSRGDGAGRALSDQPGGAAACFHAAWARWREFTSWCPATASACFPTSTKSSQVQGGVPLLCARLWSDQALPQAPCLSRALPPEDLKIQVAELGLFPDSRISFVVQNHVTEISSKRDKGISLPAAVCIHK